MFHGRPDHEVIQDITPAKILASFILMWVRDDKPLSAFEIHNLRNMANNLLDREPGAEPVSMNNISKLTDQRLNIPMDMPVFTLLAKDPVAADVVDHWIERSKDNGSAPDIIASAQAQANRMRAWEQRNPVADLPAQKADLKDVVADRLPPNG